MQNIILIFIYINTLKKINKCIYICWSYGETQMNSPFVHLKNSPKPCHTHIHTWQKWFWHVAHLRHVRLHLSSLFDHPLCCLMSHGYDLSHIHCLFLNELARCNGVQIDAKSIVNSLRKLATGNAHVFQCERNENWWESMVTACKKNLLQKKENNLFSTPMDREKGNAGMKSELCFMFSGRKSFFPRKGTTVPKKATRESVKSLL